MWYVISKKTGCVLYVTSSYVAPLPGQWVEWRDLEEE